MATRSMACEIIKAEITSLLARLADQPRNAQELDVMLREKLAELKAFGMPLPDDLVELEAIIDRRLSAEARQRTRHSERPAGRKAS